MDEISLSHLIRDHEAGYLEQMCSGGSQSWAPLLGWGLSSCVPSIAIFVTNCP